MTEQEDKAIGQFKLQVGGVLSPFNMYGLGDFIPEAVIQIAKLALKLHERLNGNDIPIRLP